MLPYSKTMRMSDMTDLQPELEVVDRVLAMLNGGDPAQHKMRRWEYAMALRVYNECKIREEKGVPLKISDHGCCTGMLAPMLRWLGNEVWMYEVWSWGNQEQHALWQMEKVVTEINNPAPYRMIHRPLGGLTDEDKGVDIAFCISTMEHIPPYEEAFRDMCRTVNDGGMLFITSDSAQDEHDHYYANNVRGGRMFNREVYERLAGWGREAGFELMGSTADWSWDNSCQLIPSPGYPNGYGFACMAMEKGR